MRNRNVTNRGLECCAEEDNLVTGNYESRGQITELQITNLLILKRNIIYWESLAEIYFSISIQRVLGRPGLQVHICK